MAKFNKDYSITVYDEPISYAKFNGGINNTPANESMQDNELRDAVNWHYNETVLERRLGAKIVADLSLLFDESFNINRERIQGSFVFGIGENTYAIIVADGRLFYTTINSDILDAVDYSHPPLVLTEAVIAVTPALITDSSVGAYTIKGDAKNCFEGLPVYNDSTTTLPDEHTGYIYNDVAAGTAKLIIQNTKLVEGIGVGDEFRLASGTRYIRMYESDADNCVLTAVVVEPTVPTGDEYTALGLNRLSPYPLRLAQTCYDAAGAAINMIMAGDLNKSNTDSAMKFQAVLSYPAGKDAQDYYFRWDFMVIDSTGAPESDWIILKTNSIERSFNKATSKGLDTISNVKMSDFGSPSIGKKVRIRCAFTEEFENVSTLNESSAVVTALVTETLAANINADTGYTLGTIEDYKHDVLQAFGSTFVTIEVMAAASIPTASPDTKFLAIHSCRKILADKNLVILYDDKDNSGGWFKSVVSDYDYISDKGNLSFQTNKNESLIRAVQFEGNIVCFGYNSEIGGSIHVVTGNGDDLDTGDGYYSPYRSRTANTQLTTDHANTVQVIENNLIFKFRDSVYIIESNDLDSDRIQGTTVNDKLKHYTWLADSSKTFDTASMVQMPNIHNNNLFDNVDYERRVYSEVTEDYYALIYPKQKLRWKMYFKLPVKYSGDPKTYYPWLRDISLKGFNIAGTFLLKGISTMITDEAKVIQYTSLDYKDIEEDTYSSILWTKAFDLGYAKFVKFLNNINVYYYRDYDQEFKLNIDIQNEADQDIYGIVYSAEHEYSEDEQRDTIVDRIIYNGTQPIDEELLIADETELDSAILGPQPRYTSKVFTPISMKPFLSISCKIEISDATNVTLGSLGFNFTTANLPDESMQNYYGNIIPF